MQSNIKTVASLLQKHQRFVLTTHVNPDGDGLGSELALFSFLRKLGKECTILNHSKTPENYVWMDPQKNIISFSPERDRAALVASEVVIVLDTNQPDRLRSMEPFVIQCPATKIVIDHHLDPHPFANHYIIDADATSTGEIVYRLITSIDASLIDTDIAQSLYTAIMTDTGSFRFPRTDPEIHRMTAHLLEFGLSPIEIYGHVYEDWPESRMRLLGEGLDSMKTAHDGKLAYIACTQKMFKETGTSEAETDNFTSFPMSVRGVVIGILFNEVANGVKISFRSKGNIPINALAKEFGGNGHKNAAGARLLNANLEDVVSAVVKQSQKYLNI